MRLLLDTHAFLWWRTEGLAPEATAAIADPRNDVFLSAASVWEIAIKRKSGRLRIEEDVASMAAEDEIDELPITFEHARLAGELPLHHPDPFDRLLIAQSQVEGLILVSRDAAMAAYGIPILSA